MPLWCLVVFCKISTPTTYTVYDRISVRHSLIIGLSFLYYRKQHVTLFYDSISNIPCANSRVSYGITADFSIYNMAKVSDLYAC